MLLEQHCLMDWKSAPSVLFHGEPQASEKKSQLAVNCVLNNEQSKFLRKKKY